ncbi:hypothetical protein J2Z42_002665 [Clostridium algifaecis]|uniref:Phage head-tail adaptor n=1 Tax=Clostridium algifaecis TaxID=1472040 RepID=A0ABS4KV97_9CLOT|nr:hypothetical protein [Clostridium algifaecis]MBP2033952.1 hypothetical protein [Clostridium algifaecis]
MKKNNIIKFLLFIFIICGLLVGCENNTKSNSQQTKDTFDMKAATNVANIYMDYLIKGDMVNIRKLYSKSMTKTPIKNENNKLNIFGYSIQDIVQVGESGVFKINVSRSDTEKAFASLDEYSIKIIKENNNYKVEETNNVVQKEAFIYKSAIKMKTKDTADVNLVMALKAVPSYVFSKDDKANIEKVPVPRHNFGFMNFSYGGKLLAVTTYDKNCYIGVIKIDESLVTQGQESGSGSDSQDTGGGETKNKEELEKPIGKEITSMDILKDVNVNFLEFSKDEKFLAVQYKTKDIGGCIRLYKVDGGDMAKYKFEDNFPLDKVNVVFSSFDEDTLSFDVLAKDKKNNSLSNIVGKWQLNLKDFKAVRM